jgi:hypothetical protein
LDNGTVRVKIDSLINALQSDTDLELVRRMKEIVPEYISQNSVFCIHDKINTDGKRSEDLSVIRRIDKEQSRREIEMKPSIKKTIR